MKLVFTKKPTNGTTITIKMATKQWSSDYAHPADGIHIDNSLGLSLLKSLLE